MIHLCLFPCDIYILKKKTHFLRGKFKYWSQMTTNCSSNLYITIKENKWKLRVFKIFINMREKWDIRCILSYCFRPCLVRWISVAAQCVATLTTEQRVRVQTHSLANSITQPQLLAYWPVVLNYNRCQGSLRWMT